MCVISEFSVKEKMKENLKNLLQYKEFVWGKYNEK